MEIEKYQEFAKEKLGFLFNDPSLLMTALTHRSYVNEHKSAHEHNERLEFLGDAVLELVSSDFLYRNYNEPEGIMTALRAALVRTESIGAAGFALGYEPLVRMSKGEKQGSERAHEVIMADCFEAVIGAIYLDQGYDAAQEFIKKHILVKIDTILEEGSWRDPKSYAQELAQKIDGITPVYKTLKEDGPDHDKTFTVGIYVGESLIGTGIGHSKQEAQTAAAREGVKKYRAKMEKK
ncbi:ribonuclease III [Candidatus Saccharibacteria bacterium]|nr:ribonuclease III [Candidatus Saccharibacteria bacterium]MDO5475105.1 ribonuclease III [Candidatus Saccharibacteria bacterium]